MAGLPVLLFTFTSGRHTLWSPLGLYRCILGMRFSFILDRWSTLASALSVPEALHSVKFRMFAFLIFLAFVYPLMLLGNLKSNARRLYQFILVDFPSFIHIQYCRESHIIVKTDSCVQSVFVFKGPLLFIHCGLIFINFVVTVKIVFVCDITVDILKIINLLQKLILNNYFCSIATFLCADILPSHSVTIVSKQEIWRSS